MKSNLSVLITTFNHERFIKTCIESFLGQGIDSEIIVYDDGSNDRTTEVVATYGNRVRLIQGNRRGVSFGLNALTAAAKHENLSFISGDDFATPLRLEQQMAAIEAEPSKIHMSRPQLVDSNSNLLKREEFPAFWIETEGTCAATLSQLFSGGNFFCAPSAVFTKTVFNKVGRFLPLSLQLQDFEYWIRSLKLDIPIKLHSQPWVNYRILRRGQNLSSLANFPRIQFEQKIVYSTFFDGMHDETLKSIKLSFGLLDDEPRDLSIIRLFLGHKSEIVRSIGLEKLFSIQAQDKVEQYLESLNLTESKFFELTAVPTYHVNKSGIIKRILTRLIK